MRSYQEMSLDERIEIQHRLGGGDSLPCIARNLGRATSTISRERKRVAGSYRAQTAQRQAKVFRRKPRVIRKLADAVPWEVVQDMLRTGWSPQQIAGILAKAFPDDLDLRVSHETIYTAVYLVPRGELQKGLMASLRQCRSTRKPRTRGVDRRGRIPDMQSIQVRPPEIEDRLIPGHWEGDLIKGAGTISSVGTWVERTSGFVVLAKMSSASAAVSLPRFGGHSG